MPTNTQSFSPPCVINCNYQAYESFNRPFVRDLALALACPTALTHWIADNNTSATTRNNSHYQLPIHLHDNEFWQQQFLAYYNRLIQLDTTNDYQQLTKFLMNRPSPNRLGFHFEGLMLFWLLDGFSLGTHTFEVLAHNVQIFDDGKTLGELDLIVKNHHTDNIEHWELAIKFFLGSPPFKPENWVGINSKDNLQRKIDHMDNKPFSQTSVTVDEKRYDIDKRFAVIKGRFFKPVNAELTYPDWLNPNLPLHTWFTAEQAKSYFRTHNCHIQTLRKAKYIEWFTNRQFLNMSNNINYNSYHLSQFDKLKTGLYFLLSSKSNINTQSIEPIVIL